MTTIDTALLRHFPLLGDADAATRAEIAAEARAFAAPAGTILARPGEALPHFVLLTEGVVRVSGISEGGREIVLYRVGPGETCVLSSACLLGRTPLSAELVAESDVAGFALPDSAFQHLVAGAPAFRRLVFANFAERLGEIVALLEDIAFQRIDRRLAAFLAQRSAGPALSLTHQAIASEIGTAREVVSRQLKEFERRGWLRLGRGTIELVDRAALARLAAG
jgi:CRP/FNR family transcriptional regulator